MQPILLYGAEIWGLECNYYLIDKYISVIRYLVWTGESQMLLFMGKL